MKTSQFSVNGIVANMMNSHKLNPESYTRKQRKLLSDMMACHTPEAGFAKSSCSNPDCHHHEIHYGSCNNPGCPACGAVKKEEWIDRQKEKVINASYYHIIFTVPDGALNRLFLHDPEFMYSALFDAQARALKKLSRDKKHFGAETIGFMSTLHTWGSAMTFHNHIHTIFCGAGLDRDGNLVKKETRYLFPAKAAAKLFKGEFLRIVCEKYETSNSPWLSDLQKAKKADWNVEIREPSNNPEAVIEYLARYINRIAISNGRITGYANGKVTFKYKDYRDHKKMKLMSLDEEEFMRRFLMHVLPENFVRIRYYGFMSSSGKKTLEKMKKLTKTRKVYKRRTRNEILISLNHGDYMKCPRCGCELNTVIYQPRRPKGSRHKVIHRAEPGSLISSG